MADQLTKDEREAVRDRVAVALAAVAGLYARLSDDSELGRLETGRGLNRGRRHLEAAQGLLMRTGVPGD
jgi:hypothetical protein